MMDAIRRRLQLGDAGITLIETMIYAVLSVVVVTIAGGLVASNARVNSAVQASTTSSGTGQSIARSLTTGVLNADWASTPTTSGTQFFAVHTAGQGATVTWYCQAWYYTSANGGSIYTKRSSTKIAPPTALTGWTLLGTGITPPAGSSVFSGSGTGITLAMNVVSKGADPVLIRTSTTKRQSAAGVTPCQ